MLLQKRDEMLKAKAFIGKTPSLPGSDFLLLFSGDTEAGMCNYKLQSNISQIVCGGPYDWDQKCDWCGVKSVYFALAFGTVLLRHSTDNVPEAIQIFQIELDH